MVPLLSLRGVGVAAGGTPLLGGIELDLLPGEIVAVTGPSGCGKTTLLRAICGLDDPLAGEILLSGKPAGAWGWPAFRRRVLLVEQRPTLLEDTVEANLRRPFTYRSASDAYPAERAAALLEEMGVGRDRLSQAARSLSVGQQQRVCLIRALLPCPPVLLLDEPTSALDADAVEQAERALRVDRTEQGGAALVVTHDLALADRWCDRRIDLRPYAIAPSGNAKENACTRQPA